MMKIREKDSLADFIKASDEDLLLMQQEKQHSEKIESFHRLFSRKLLPEERQKVIELCDLMEKNTKELER